MTGGWNFSSGKTDGYKGKPVPLKDTVIAAIRYRRLRLNMDTLANDSFVDCYLRCDLKVSLFTFNPELSKIAGCPIVRDSSFVVSNGSAGSQSIAFLTDTLTAKEIRVFKAWRKNAGTR